MKLSILIPTRNRVKYLHSIVNYILKSSRRDFEIIISDASDEHKNCLLVLENFISDERLKLIDNSTCSDGRVKSMNDNWGMALSKARGEWIVIIGDDDMCDPNLINFIEAVEKVMPNINAIKWNPIHADLDIKNNRGAKIPMGNKVLVADCKQSLLSQSSWPHAKKPPHSLCSPYHGAVKKSILEMIFLKNDHLQFKFNTPDYDLGWNVCLNSDSFILCERPFSISGVSEKSNSYSVRNSFIRKINQERWNFESKTMDGWGLTDNPFYFSFPMAVLGFINAFCKINNIENKINAYNFVETLKNTLNNQENEESFCSYKKEVSLFLEKQFNNNFLIDEIKFSNRRSNEIGGLFNETIYINNEVYNDDVEIFYKYAFGILKPAHMILV